MLLSSQRRFIFIHIPKTGGSSVRRALRPYAPEPRVGRALKNIRFPMRLLPYPWKIYWPHITAVQLKKRLPAAVWSRSYRFAFVRNPWSRSVSHYFFVREHRAHPGHKVVSRMRSFEEYLLWRQESDPWGHLTNQVEWLCDEEGQLIVDFVGRFENLEADFAAVCAQLGVTAELPHVNPSEHGDYRSYYDDRLRELVGQSFERDIRFFGFSFDGASSQT